jgi:hypothetical protein
MVDVAETVDDLDEAKVLGYFETLKSAFFMKLVFLGTHSGGVGKGFRYSSFDPAFLEDVGKLISCEQELKALRNENLELVQNFIEDIVRGALIGSWMIFELVIKDLATPNYSQRTEDLNADFGRALFGFEKRHKKDLELFYYFRNALAHHNGAYFKSKDIDHTYRSVHFKSKDNWGKMIIISPELAFQIILDMEKHTLHAWASAKTHKARLAAKSSPPTT